MDGELIPTGELRPAEGIQRPALICSCLLYTSFQALLARGPVLLDGATGSNLMRAGMPRGICTEVWVTEHPAVSYTHLDVYKRQDYYSGNFSAAFY